MWEPEPAPVPSFMPLDLFPPSCPQLLSGVLLHQHLLTPRATLFQGERKGFPLVTLLPEGPLGGWGGGEG